MCTFVTLVARTSDIEGLNAVLATRDERGRRRRAGIVGTPCLRPLLAKDENEFWLVDPPCDCGTYLGSALVPESTPGDRLRSASERYRRKGWSSTKIARALAAQENASSRPHRHGGPKEEAGYWIGLLSDIAIAMSLPSVGLMHHFYARAPGDEAFDAARRKAGAIHGASDMLARMQDGVIHDFECPV